MLPKKPAFRSLITAIAIFLSLAGAYASQSVTVTVHPGDDHLFRGFGVNYATWRDPFRLEGVTRELMDSIVEIIFSPEEMGFKYLRLFAHPTKMFTAYSETNEMNGDFHGAFYEKIFRNAKTYQPNLKYLWCPWIRSCPDLGNAQDDLSGYAERMVGIAKTMKDDYGFDWTASGVFNEPQNDPDLVDDKHIAQLVLLFREEFDRVGMSDVNIIGPECSNVLDWNPPNSPKGSHMAMIDSIFANPAAKAALDGIGYHSYNYGAAKWFRDKVRPSGKELWQTESGIHGREGGEKEIHHAAQQSAIILSDLNLLASYWFFFLPFSPENFVYDSSVNFFGQALNLFIITHRPGEDLQVRSWLKTDYMRSLTRSFKPETWMRFCTSDLEPWTRNDRDRFTYMENTNRDISGELSQICAAVGRRADSSWVMAAVNRTGLPGIAEDTVWNADGTVAWMKHSYAPADSFIVTFDVAELAESEEVVFQVTRCNQQNRCFEDGTATMVEGIVTVPTAATELVTLQSAAGIPITSIRHRGMGQSASNGSYTLKNIGRNWVISVHAAAQAEMVTDIFNSRGSKVRSLSAGTGQSTIEWDGLGANGSPVAPGVYHVRFTHGQFTATAAINIVR